MVKLGNKVRLTPQRFHEFHGGQGVTDPSRVSTIIKIENTTIWLDFPISQGYGFDDLVLVNKKPTVIIIG